MKKPIDIDRPGKKKKAERITGSRDPRQGPDAIAAPSETPAPAGLQDTARSASKAVASSQQPQDAARDAAFKKGIAVLRSTKRKRE